MAPRLSEEQLAQMTEEEREGFLDEDLTEEGEPGVSAGDDDDDDAGGDDTGSGKDKTDDDAGDGDDGDGDGDDDDDADAAAAAAAEEAAKAKADEEAAAAAAAAAAEAGGDDDDAPDPNEKAPTWIVPNDLPAKLEEINEQRKELAKKFDDGELTADELHEQQKTLDAQYREVDRRLLKAEIAKENAIEDWKDEVASFFKGNSAYETSDVLRDMLDKEVKKLQATAVNPLNPKILERAHKNIAGEVKKAFGIDMPVKTPDDKGEAGKSNKDKPKPKPRDEPPPNLGKVPAADATDADDGGEFAYLDRMRDKDSVAFEAELAKLSPAKLDEYMAQG